MVRLMVAGFLLLAWAVTASAECGWVLWETEIRTNCKDPDCQWGEKNVQTDRFVLRDDAFETKAECDNRANRLFQIASSGKPHVVKRFVNGVNRDTVVVNLYRCWPAGVDIRQ
jgi:hypothetical protein